VLASSREGGARPDKGWCWTMSRGVDEDAHVAIVSSLQSDIGDGGAGVEEDALMT
jgi:hypothetical protein